MYDPIGGFERIRDLFITYLETAFRIRDPELSKRRRALLEKPGTLCTEPLIEPVPRYRSVGRSLADLRTQPLAGYAAGMWATFIDLAAAGLFGSSEIHPYAHQWEMLERGLQQGRPAIVTSGTGSGKTEAFLLPVLATLVREASTWPRAPANYLRREDHWWYDRAGGRCPTYRDARRRDPTNKDPWLPHRIGESAARPAAVRCLILYPMNALVEDQLTRLRKTLDSNAAREVLDRELGGNRFFFGRYNGLTPVTGFRHHPRPCPKKEGERRGKLLRELFLEMLKTDRARQAADDQVRAGILDADDAFLFPSVDGAELISRWDMQEDPPDILVSNISMLGGMLYREVESPIFERTREWLRREDAYFFLVLDELHLHRGSAGTEVAYLLRLLLDRLGLTAPEQRHKLRILASSASLPTGGEEGVRSSQYLWDMFGDHGTWGSPRGKADRPSDWNETIIPGEPVHESRRRQTLRPEPFAHFLDEHVRGGVATPPDVVNAADWLSLADALGTEPKDSDSCDALARGVIEESARQLAHACWCELEQRHRATAISQMALRLFGDAGECQRRAVRGLLFLRGIGDAPCAGGARPIATSFRMHTFFRGIEGLYAPILSDPHSPRGYRVGELSVERETTDSDVARNRLVELLYSECCGELFVGGLRADHGSGRTELVPAEADLEGLPDSARVRAFEEQTWNDYALFWPTRPTQNSEVGEGRPGITERWKPVTFDPSTSLAKKAASGSHDTVAGFLYDREGTGEFGRGAAGSHVPFACPACGTDYSPRLTGRLSPLRHFRPGFSRTTQVLATEFFAWLRLHDEGAKLVSFSDSRQEAAKTAFAIETRHHEDLRRLLLVEKARAMRGELAWSDGDESKLTRLEELLPGLETGEAQSLQALVDGMKKRRGAAQAGWVELRKFASHEGPPGLSLSGLAALGVHPGDAAGVEELRGGQNSPQRFEWNELLSSGAASTDWRSDTSSAIANATSELRGQVVRGLTATLFSRSYFALEEAGLGWVGLAQGKADRRQKEVYGAWVRLFADAYRLRDGQWGAGTEWQGPAMIHQRNRIRKFAIKLYGVGQWTGGIQNVLDQLTNSGHANGLLDTTRLVLHLADGDSPFWRCSHCERIHLHRGVEHCHTVLPAPSG